MADVEHGQAFNEVPLPVHTDNESAEEKAILSPRVLKIVLMAVLALAICIGIGLSIKPNTDKEVTAKVKSASDGKSSIDKVPIGKTTSEDAVVDVAPSTGIVKVGIPWTKVAIGAIILALLAASAVAIWYFVSEGSLLQGLLSKHDDLLEPPVPVDVPQTVEPITIVKTHTSWTDWFLNLNIGFKVLTLLGFAVAVVVVRVITLASALYYIYKNNATVVTPGPLEINLRPDSSTNTIEITAGANINSVFADIFNVSAPSVSVDLFAPALTTRRFKVENDELMALDDVTEATIFKPEYNFAKASIRDAIVLASDPKMKIVMTLHEKVNLNHLYEEVKKKTSFTDFSNWHFQYGYRVTGKVFTTALGFPFWLTRSHEGYSIKPEKKEEVKPEAAAETDMGPDGEAAGGEADIGHTKGDEEERDTIEVVEYETVVGTIAEKQDAPLWGVVKALSKSQGPRWEPRINAFLSLDYYKIPLKISSERVEINIGIKDATQKDVIKSEDLSFFIEFFDKTPEDFGTLPEYAKDLKIQPFAMGISLNTGATSNLKETHLENYGTLSLQISGANTKPSFLSHLVKTLDVNENIGELEAIVSGKSTDITTSLMASAVVDKVVLKDTNAPRNPQLAKIMPDFGIENVEGKRSFFFNIDAHLAVPKLFEWFPDLSLDFKPIDFVVSVHKGMVTKSIIGKVKCIMKDMKVNKDEEKPEEPAAWKPNMQVMIQISIHDLSMLSQAIVRYLGSHRKLPGDIVGMSNLRVEGDLSADFTGREYLEAAFKLLHVDLDLISGAIGFRTSQNQLSHSKILSTSILHRSTVIGAGSLIRSSRLGSSVIGTEKPPQPTRTVTLFEDSLFIKQFFKVDVKNAGSEMAVDILFQPTLKEYFAGNNVFVEWKEKDIQVAYKNQTLVKVNIEKGGILYEQSSQAGGLTAIRGIADSYPKIKISIPDSVGSTVNSFIADYTVNLDGLDIDISINQSLPIWLPTKSMIGESEASSTDSTNKAKSKKSSTPDANVILPTFARNLITVESAADHLRVLLKYELSKYSEKKYSALVTSGIVFTVSVERLEFAGSLISGNRLEECTDISVVIPALNMTGSQNDGMMEVLTIQSKSTSSGLIRGALAEIYIAKIGVSMAKYLTGSAESYKFIFREAHSNPAESIVKGYLKEFVLKYDEVTAKTMKEKALLEAPKVSSTPPKGVNIYGDAGEFKIDLSQSDKDDYIVDADITLPKVKYPENVPPQTVWEVSLPEMYFDVVPKDFIDFESSSIYASVALPELYIPLFLNGPVVDKNEYSKKIHLKATIGARCKSFRAEFPKYLSDSGHDFESLSALKLTLGPRQSPLNIDISKQALVEFTTYAHKFMRSFVDPAPSSAASKSPPVLTDGSATTTTTASVASDPSIAPTYQIDQVLKPEKIGTMPCPVDGLCPISSCTLEPTVKIPILLAKRLLSSIPSIYQTVCNSLLWPSLPKTLKYSVQVHPTSFVVHVNKSFDLAEIAIDLKEDLVADLEELNEPAEKRPVPATSSKAEVALPVAAQPSAYTFDPADYIILNVTVKMNKGDEAFHRWLRPLKFHPLHIVFSMDDVYQMLYTTWMSISSKNPVIDMVGTLLQDIHVKHFMTPVTAPELKKPDSGKAKMEVIDEYVPEIIAAEVKPPADASMKIVAESATAELFKLRIENVMPATVPYAHIVEKLSFSIYRQNYEVINIYVRREGKGKYNLMVELKNGKYLGPMIADWLKGQLGQAELRVNIATESGKSEVLMTTMLEFSKESQYVVELMHGIFDRMSVPPIGKDGIKDDQDIIMVGNPAEAVKMEGGNSPLFLSLTTFALSSFLASYNTDVELGIRQNQMPKWLQLAASLKSAVLSATLPKLSSYIKDGIEDQFALELNPVKPANNIPIFEPILGKSLHADRSMPLGIKGIVNLPGLGSYSTSISDFFTEAGKGDYIDRSNKLTNIKAESVIALLNKRSYANNLCLRLNNQSRFDLLLGQTLSNVPFALPLPLEGLEYPMTFGGYTDGCKVVPFCKCSVKETVLPTASIRPDANWKFKFDMEVDQNQLDAINKKFLSVNFSSASGKTVSVRFYPRIVDLGYIYNGPPYNSIAFYMQDGVKPVEFMVNGKHLKQDYGVFSMFASKIGVEMVYKASEQRIHIKTWDDELSEGSRDYIHTIFPMNFSRALDNEEYTINVKSEAPGALSASNTQFGHPSVAWKETKVTYSLENLPRVNTEFSLSMSFTDECGLAVNNSQITCGLVPENSAADAAVIKPTSLQRNTGNDLKLIFKIDKSGPYLIKCTDKVDVWNAIPNRLVYVTNV